MRMRGCTTSGNRRLIWIPSCKPFLVEDEVDAYEALALADRVSELSNAATLEHSDFVLSGQLNRKGDMCVAFHILHDVLCEGKVACICL